MRHLATLAATFALLAACSKAPGGGDAQPDFNTDVPMSEFMLHFVDPAAFMYWRGSGVEVTEAGERDLSPTTDEGWETLVTGATMLVEAGNLMQIPGRTRAPEADWNKYARMLTERALVARDAAEKRDKQAVFDEGGRVYEVCVACHEQFVIAPQEEAEAPLPPHDPPAGR
ncbi:hypothetical protein [Phenylobacterium sp. SCN 70-31]|uniref:hypothetical protein n=1 Tax=Phenylobacterium sp. SCN 70-31 TaxID=1660129 RepID=UPI00086BB328|nr:hypothetical protein [Phenylobacterium sp. SCN 70-31]ODT85163.1 MAG: hypothetical protein ABS78_21525 [Phenylobacterium sp. SCN 70-31]